MLSNDENRQDQPNVTQKVSGGAHTGIIAGLAAGLVLALAGDAYLINRSNDLNDQVSQVKQDAKTEFAKLSESTTALLEQDRQQLQALSDDVSGKYETANQALQRTRMSAQKASKDLAAKLDEQQKAVGEEIGQLKDATTSATAKLNDDVTGVKTDVGSVRTDLTATRTDLDKTGADLKRAMGDMGVMSGLIATNAKDLQSLRELGDRNYFEFDLEKGAMTKKVGNVTLTLKRADPKRNRYTITVLADDKLVEKRDKTINEPVQLYSSNSKQPYEIVVNQVKKDGVVGYLATPKVSVARNN
jgi:chromosome segregation ATPase